MMERNGGEAKASPSMPGLKGYHFSDEEPRLFHHASYVCGGDKLDHGSAGLSDAGGLKLCHL